MRFYRHNAGASSSVLLQEKWNVKHALLLFIWLQNFLSSYKNGLFLQMNKN